MVKLELEFSGGMELLFGNQRRVEVDVPVTSTVASLTIGDTLGWLRDNLLKERPELFMKDDTIRPGVLILLNDADWELSGMEESELEDGDKLTFISTLHGG
jgi:ubiquitin related modifier 1